MPSSQLGRLLEMCVRDEPGIASLEDFLPSDPRDRVVVRWGEHLVRLFPGSVERPVADVDRALLVSKATDEVLVARMGFGVRDLVDVALGYGDFAIRALAATWGAERSDNGVAITDDEVTAASTLIGAGTPDSLVAKPGAARALEWATCDAAALPYRPGHPSSPFGRYLRVRRPALGDRTDWLPLACLPEIMGHGVAELAAVAGASQTANRRFAQLVAAHVRKALWSFSSNVIGPTDWDDGPVVTPDNRVQWVAMLGPGRALLVQIMAHLRPIRPPFADRPVALAVTEAARLNPGAPIAIPMARGTLHLDPRTEVVPLLVVGSASYVAAPHGPGFTGMSLDDLRWAASTASSESDLYMFCRDMARQDRPNVFALETIDVWEWWRGNGQTLFAGGRAPDLMTIAPHHGTAEWERAAADSSLEEAMFALGFPALRDVDAVERSSLDTPSVYQWRLTTVAPPAAPPAATRGSTSPDGEDDSSPERSPAFPDLVGWKLVVGPVPVGIVELDPAWPEEDRRFLDKLAGAFAFGFHQISAVWASCHAGSGVAGYVVELSSRPDDESQDSPIAVDHVETILNADGHRTVRAAIGVACRAMAEQTAADPEQSQAHMANAVHDMLRKAGSSAEAAGRVAAAWTQARPTLAVQVATVPTSRNDLPMPVELNEALVSETERSVARAVRRSGIRPGVYRGDDAKDLERMVLAPAALKIMTHRMAVHDGDELVLVGMEQLERIVAHRSRTLGDIGQSAGLMDLAWDPVVRYRETGDKYLLLRRCAETVVEAALRTGPTGSKPCDKLAWGEILAAASSYLAATMRSENVRHQVRPTTIYVDDSFEVTATADEEPPSAADSRVYDLDVAAFADARAAFDLTTGRTDPEPDADLGGLLLDAEVDAAMRRSYSTSGTDVLTTLMALAAWPQNADDEKLPTASTQQVVDYILEATRIGEEPDATSRVAAAVAMLTSTRTDLRDADWKPWHARTRKRRLLVQPLPELSDGTLVVASHFCLTSLTVYKNYLSQGQLPWSQPPPPATVDTALERLRDRRNKALEKQVARVLRRHGWTVIENVKENKAQRLNLPQLTTEIDAVAGRIGQRTLWLLEVKDPTDAFAVPEIRRHLDHFFRGQKKPSYVTQLARKNAELSPHADRIAQALQLPDIVDGESYVVKSLFVTRKPVPAAFVTSEYGFCTLTDLPDRLAGVDFSTEER
ncbi:hypothetical protein [Candidatus Protofrankia californiensis]|uniref:hypothetical protein n=1 Tax=Candidatus Protofrankia californiensis TaxID=1839754 RepID=UPI0010414781|nr:hypothetical protein [Candidatus Protofrankia californiensis]